MGSHLGGVRVVKGGVWESPPFFFFFFTKVTNEALSIFFVNLTYIAKVEIEFICKFFLVLFYFVVLYPVFFFVSFFFFLISLSLISLVFLFRFKLIENVLKNKIRLFRCT